jgi:NAD(P)-dependent dehydrogenase (short-subunit alcohol dehydrogenase family)
MSEAPPPRAFAGRSVLITGASSGLGAALAQSFAEAGARLTLFSRNGPALEVVARACQPGDSSPLVVTGDVTQPQDCAVAVESAVARFGGIDVVVACAGLGMWARFDSVDDPAILKQVMDVNYGGLVNITHQALPHLKSSRGILVAISSVQGTVGVPYHTGYAASKHAVQGFCNSLRMELRGSGVDILTVLAHWISGTRLREQALGPDGTPRGQSSHRHGSGAVPVENMARAVIRATLRRERALFVPRKLRYLSWLSAVAPALADRIIIHRVEKEASRK